jgi:hypothetical protein
MKNYNTRTLGSKRENCGRSRIFDAEGVEDIVEAVANDPFLDASMIARDPELNPDNASRWTVQRVLNEEGLYPFIPLKIMKISEDAAQNRLEWCTKMEH